MDDPKPPRRKFLKYLGFSTAAATIAGNKKQAIGKAVEHSSGNIFVSSADHILSNAKEKVKVIIVDDPETGHSINTLFLTNELEKKGVQVVTIDDKQEDAFDPVKTKILLNETAIVKPPPPFILENKDYIEFYEAPQKGKKHKRRPHQNSSGHNINKTRKKNKAARKQRKRK